GGSGGGVPADELPTGQCRAGGGLAAHHRADLSAHGFPRVARGALPVGGGAQIPAVRRGVLRVAPRIPWLEGEEHTDPGTKRLTLTIFRGERGQELSGRHAAQGRRRRAIIVTTWGLMSRAATSRGETPAGGRRTWRRGPAASTLSSRRRTSGAATPPWQSAQ